MSHISQEQFAKRFVALVSRGNVIPKKHQDLHILLISAVLRLEPGRHYSEKELNDELRHWSSPFGEQMGFDHVTLRRYLIDEGYLKRDAAGSSYEHDPAHIPYTYDPEIKDLDLEELLREAERERKARKQRYLKGSRK